MAEASWTTLPQAPAGEVTVSHVGIVSSDPRLEDLLRPSGLRLSRVEAGAWAALSGAGAPAVLVADLRRETHVPPALAAYRREHPAVAVVLVVSSFEAGLMLEAMRAGIAECVAEPLTAPALAEAVQRVLVHVRAASPGQVMAFVGAKGGVGTTTLAVNTAAALARHGDGDVLLMDLHSAYGDAAVFLGAEPRFSVADALDQVHRVDDALFRSLVERTRAGLDLLASPDRPAEAAADPGRIRLLLDFAARRYRYTVLDLPRGGTTMFDALDAVTTIVVVVSQELTALRNAGRLVETLKQRCGQSRVRVAIGRFDRHAEIGKPDVERALGMAAVHIVPSDYRLAIEALNAGRPIVVDGKSRTAHAVRRLAKDLAGTAAATPERPMGLLGRLVPRRA